MNRGTVRIVHGALAGLIALGAVPAGSAFAAGGKLVIADAFSPTAGWALETDDAFVLTRAGCLEALARVDFEGALVPALATGWLNLTLLAYTERAELPDLAAVIQSQLGQIGVKVEIRASNYGGIEPDLMSGNFDMFVLSRNHLTDVADPIAFLTADYTCDGGFNVSNFCDPSVDAAVEEARGTADPAARNALYAKVAAQLQDEAVTAFLVHVQHIEAVSEKVQSYRIHPLGHYVLVPELALSE